MGYRWFVGFVVMFWGIMTGLLVRTRLQPDALPGWLRIPPEHVLELMFRQQEDSELLVLQANRRQGQVYLMPRRDADGGRRLAINGELFMRLPGMPKTQRVLFDGRLALAGGFAVAGFVGRISLREPPLTASIEVDPATGTYRYQALEAGREIGSGSGTFEELLRDPRLAAFGVGPERWKEWKETGDSVRIEAHPAELRVRGERIETYRVSVHSASMPPWVFHVSPTGRVLWVDTPLGCLLVAEGLQNETPQTDPP